MKTVVKLTLVINRLFNKTSVFIYFSFQAKHQLIRIVISDAYKVIG